MTLTKYNGLRVFKSSERTAMTLSDSDIVVPMAVTETFTGTVHSIVMSTLQTFYKCPHCDETLDCDGSSAWCEKCDVGLSTNAILKIKELLSAKSGKLDTQFQMQPSALRRNDWSISRK